MAININGGHPFNIMQLIEICGSRLNWRSALFGIVCFSWYKMIGSTLGFMERIIIVTLDGKELGR